MKTSDFDYHLPGELIAQTPLPDRSSARMMVLDRSAGTIAHRVVSDLPGFLRSGDLIVVNDTRVIPARLMGKKAGTGGQAEILLLEETSPGRWLAMHRASGKARKGTVLVFAGGAIELVIDDVLEDGKVVVTVTGDKPLAGFLESAGTTPLPPYIKRPAGAKPEDRERYQTIYATHPGAVAAPTAGLHFSSALLDSLKARGIGLARLTLHVGPGTFKPVSADNVEDHKMDSERYELSRADADLINRTRAAGGRIVAVGTTTVRTLETLASPDGTVQTGSGRTDIFIRPPYKFRAVDSLLTNFHLPMSTLIMLVSAFAGKELLMQAYREAVEQRYRFYSYGDCMFIV